MTLLFTVAALAAAPAPAVAPPAPPAAHAMHAMHAQHAQQSKPGAKPHGDGCSCCKDMAGGAKMKHGEGHGADHSGHSAKH